VTVVVGFLGTPESRAALGHAIRECTVRRDELIVVVPESVATGAEFTADLALAHASLGRQEIAVRRVASEDLVGAELVDLSYKDSVDLVVVGLKRRSPVGKLVMGSMSQKVLLDAQCPVTAVKPPVLAHA
jgi:nucleotide-binding universal stress UspA family protein